MLIPPPVQPGSSPKGQSDKAFYLSLLPWAGLVAVLAVLNLIIWKAFSRPAAAGQPAGGTPAEASQPQKRLLGAKFRFKEAATAVVTGPDGSSSSSVTFSGWNEGDAPIYLLRGTVTGRMQDGSIHPASASSPYILFIADEKSPIMPGAFYSEAPGDGYLLPFVGGQGIVGGEVWITEALSKEEACRKFTYSFCQ